MKIVIVDDSIDVAQIFMVDRSPIELFHLDATGIQTVRELAKTIADGEYGDDAIYLINLDLKLLHGFRQYFAGVELLTWLRVKKITNHCVLYSYRSPEFIGAIKQQNLMIFAEGSSFLHLPCDFRKLSFNELANKRAKTDNLKSYLRASFRIGEFRHRDANWWAIKQLWDVYYLGYQREAYPDHVAGQLKSLNNSVAAFLHDLDVKDLSGTVELKIQEYEAKINEFSQLNQHYSELTETLHGLRQKVAAIEEDTDINLDEQFELEYESRFQDVFGSAQYVNRFAQLLLDKKGAENQLNEIDTKIAIAEKTIESQEKELADLRRYITTAQREIRMMPFEGVPEADVKPRILVIDDCAEMGWLDIYGKLFPQCRETIEHVVPDNHYRNSLEELYRNEIKPKVEGIWNSEEASIILLDLRLFDEINLGTDVESVSGTRILRMIRNDFPAIPILITTASNKSWTFAKMISLGADGVWVKEGLDENRTASDSVENYCRLMSLVYRLCDDQYGLMCSFAKFAEEFSKTRESHWSNSVVWYGQEEPIAGNTVEIARTLSDCVSSMRAYLREFHLGSAIEQTVPAAFVLSGLINKLAGVYELVHGILQSRYIDDRTLMKIRGDMNLTNLKRLRNRFSHANFQACRWEDLETAIIECKNYLEEPFEWEVETKTVLRAEFTFYQMHPVKLNIIFQDGTKLTTILEITREDLAPGYVDRRIDCTRIFENWDIEVVRVAPLRREMLSERTRTIMARAVKDRYGTTPLVSFGEDSSLNDGRLKLAYANSSLEDVILLPPKYTMVDTYFDRLKERQAEMRLCMGLEGEWKLNLSQYRAAIGALLIPDPNNSEDEPRDSGKSE